MLEVGKRGCTLQSMQLGAMHRSAKREAITVVRTAELDDGKRLQRRIRREWLMKLAVDTEEARAHNADVQAYEQALLQLKVCRGTTGTAGMPCSCG